MIAAIMSLRESPQTGQGVTGEKGGAGGPGEVLDATRNIEAATMHGDPEPMRKMLDTLVTDGTGTTHYLA